MALCSSMQVLVVISTLLACITTSFSEGECQFCYSKQPPSSPTGCNPYGATSIQLLCNVEGPVGAILDIRWFFKPDTTNGEAATELQSSHHIVTTATTIKIIHSKLIISNLAVGNYWCRVYHNNNALLSSQEFGVASEDDYSREDSCTDNISFSEDTEKCADIPVPDDLIPQAIESSTCPLNELQATVLPNEEFTTKTLIPSVMIASSTSHIVPVASQSSTNQLPTSTMVATMFAYTSSTTDHSLSSTIVLLETHRPGNSTEGLQKRPEGDTWLYAVIGLTGMLLLLIVVLLAVFFLLCLSRPKSTKVNHQGVKRRRMDTLTSPVTTDPPSRPLTALTMQTDILLGTSPTVQESRAVYNSFDMDYEDIDEGKEVEQFGNIPSATNPRYHEQGPTVVAAANSQPIYTIPTQSPDLVQYSEVGSPSNVTNSQTASQEQDGGLHTTMPSLQAHGYGKLDHSRPRHTYNPKRDSPLLSGYRKLDHIRGISSRATTLPHGGVAPGYANISIPNGGSGNSQHIRSASLPSSEYSNLNPNSMSQPTTPTSSLAVTPTGSRKYSNFEIIEACGEENGETHAPISRRASEDYHMLADATIDRTDPVPNIREEYEFLPVCMCEDDGDISIQSPDSLHLQLGTDIDRLMMRKGMGSLGRELIEEKMSINSHSSADFTGPFFFPHMPSFGGGQVSPDDRHVYRSLEVSTMEPQKGYASVSVKNE